MSDQGGHAGPPLPGPPNSQQPTPNNPVCPFCGSPRTEVVSLFGSQLLVDQRRCLGCSSYFEAVRDDR